MDRVIVQHFTEQFRFDLALDWMKKELSESDRTKLLELKLKSAG